MRSPLAWLRDLVRASERRKQHDREIQEGANYIASKPRRVRPRGSRHLVITKH